MYLRVFGCTCYEHLQENQKNKLEARAEKCIFLGCPYGKKDYRCYNPSNRKIYVSRDVKFLECIPFLSKNETDIFSLGEKSSIPFSMTKNETKTSLHVNEDQPVSVLISISVPYSENQSRIEDWTKTRFLHYKVKDI